MPWQLPEAKQKFNKVAQRALDKGPQIMIERVAETGGERDGRRD